MEHKPTSSDKKLPEVTDTLIFDNDSNTGARSQGRAVMMAIAIVALLFINAGIFYTARISQQTDHSLVEQTTSDAVTTSKLATDKLERLTGRVSVDVEPQLVPFSSGRDNPFIAP